MQTPGITHPLSHSPPTTLLNISPTFPPAQLSIQLLPPQGNSAPAQGAKARSLPNSDRESPEFVARARSNSEPQPPQLEEVAVQQVSSNYSAATTDSPSQKPVPKPRKVKKHATSEEAEGVAGAESSWEESQETAEHEDQETELGTSGKYLHWQEGLAGHFLVDMHISG